MSIECPACDRPTTDYLCKTCLGPTGELHRKLATVGHLLAELDVTIGKRDKTAPDGPRVAGSASNPMPINATAADIKSHLIDAIHGVHLGTKPVRVRFLEEPVKLALWSREQLGRLGTNPKAPAIRQQFLAAYERAVKAVDLPAEKISLGECGNIEEGIECVEALSVEVGEPFVNCTTCSATWDVKARQREAISDAWHTVGILPSVLRALKQSGHVDIPLKRAEAWVMRGKLSPAEGTLYTPAAVLKAYHETPTGKRELKVRAA